jgi:diguanylate cyclase (GGDEF)-like protein
VTLAPAPSPALQDASILIVDDDPGAIRILRAALRDYKHVRFATNGADAMRLSRENPPDLILLDSEMPGENGFEFCARVKLEPLLHDVPVIFVTSHDDLEFETRALGLGAADFLPKPISAPRVELRVRLHLQLKHQLDQLRSLASTDGLTGLANRRVADETLKREWRRAQRSGRPLSLLLIDVDYFKLFNDRYGHPAGDGCLKQVAAAVRSAARRPTDLAARFGGEEFAVVLAETSLSGARLVADSIRRSIIESSIPHADSEVASHVTVSIGAACLGADPAVSERRSGPPLPSSHAFELVDLIEAADKALYRAKKTGRNRVESSELGS